VSDEDVIGGPLVLRHERSSGTWERKIMPDEQRCPIWGSPPSGPKKLTLAVLSIFSGTCSQFRRVTGIAERSSPKWQLRSCFQFLGPSQATTRDVEPSYAAAWKADAVKALQRLHAPAATATNESIWTELSTAAGLAQRGPPSWPAGISRHASADWIQEEPVSAPS